MRIQATNQNSKQTSTINFNGLRRVINADTVRAFLEKTEQIGEVDLFKRTFEEGKEKLSPIKAALVKCKLSRKKSDRESKIFYALFERGYQKAATTKGLDNMELGLVGFQYKNLRNAKLFKGTEREIASAREAISQYNEALKILNLISFEGKTYKGIGTALINNVIQTSHEMGLGGKVFLYAQNLFPEIYLKESKSCAERVNTSLSPVKFYYNLGFRADRDTNRLLEAKKFNIDCFTMHLPLLGRKK